MHDFVAANRISKTGEPYRGGVIVQRMVMAEFAGICLTCDSSAGHADALILEMTAGGNEAITAGTVVPDRFIVDRLTGDLLEVDRRCPGLRQASLDVGGLVGQFLTLEAKFGQPLDIEWAVVGGTLYILQARPIVGRVAPACEDFPHLTPRDGSDNSARQASLAVPPDAPAVDGWRAWLALNTSTALARRDPPGRHGQRTLAAVDARISHPSQGAHSAGRPVRLRERLTRRGGLLPRWRPRGTLQHAPRSANIQCDAAPRLDHSACVAGQTRGVHCGFPSLAPGTASQGRPLYESSAIR